MRSIFQKIREIMLSITNGKRPDLSNLKEFPVPSAYIKLLNQEGKTPLSQQRYFYLKGNVDGLTRVDFDD